MSLSFPTARAENPALLGLGVRIRVAGIQQTKAGGMAHVSQILEMASANFGIAEDGVHLKSQYHHTDKLLIAACHGGE